MIGEKGRGRSIKSEENGRGRNDRGRIVEGEVIGGEGRNDRERTVAGE